MLNKMKKAIGTLLIAGLGGLAGASLYSNYSDSSISTRNISDKQNVAFIGAHR